MARMIEELKPQEVDMASRVRVTDLLNEIRAMAEAKGTAIQALGGLVVIGATKDPRPQISPAVASRWLDGIAYAPDGKVTVAAHWFMGDDGLRPCREWCGTSVIDPAAEDPDFLMGAGTGESATLVSVELKRLRASLEQGQGNPLTDNEALQLAHSFYDAGHRFDGQSPLLAAAATS